MGFDMQLTGKVAIVGGASRGIGRDIAVALAAAGVKVVVAARSEVEPDPRLPGTIHHTVADIQEAGGEAIAVKADVSDEEQINAMVNTTLEWRPTDASTSSSTTRPSSSPEALWTCRPDTSTCTTRSISKDRFCVFAQPYRRCWNNNKGG
ncbi:hypothetical protein C2W62_26655 [Candidatus Entotheonella serta]|nr:hypothetical protein C2W62_26655 [Candidatus Entotheonella serta]